MATEWAEGVASETALPLGLLNQALRPLGVLRELESPVQLDSRQARVSFYRRFPVVIRDRAPALSRVLGEPALAGGAGDLVCEHLGTAVLPPQDVRTKHPVGTAVTCPDRTAFARCSGEQVPCRRPGGDGDDGHMGAAPRTAVRSLVLVPAPEPTLRRAACSERVKLTRSGPTPWSVACRGARQEARALGWPPPRRLRGRSGRGPHYWRGGPG
jgi:hypothetical protein